MGAAPSHQEQEASSASSRNGVGRAAVLTMAPSASTTSDTANQAQSKRAPPPHMFREIVAGEKVTDVAALEDQASTGILLAGKTKKYWVDGRTRHNCFMLLPRGLHITWSEDPKYWTWKPLRRRVLRFAGRRHFVARRRMSDLGERRHFDGRRYGVGGHIGRRQAGGYRARRHGMGRFRGQNFPNRHRSGPATGVAPQPTPVAP